MLFKKELISQLVVLRDWINLSEKDYNFNHELKMVVDIADTIYNVGYPVVNNFDTPYKCMYNAYGKDFWDSVIEDASAIDSQVNNRNIMDLIHDTNILLSEI